MRVDLVTIIALLLLPDVTSADDANGLARDPVDAATSSIDLHPDLGYNSVNSGNHYLRLEHSLPLLPHAMISKRSIDENARGRLSRTLDSGGSSFTVGGDVDSSVQYRQSDVIFYYSILDTSASIDVGVNARYIESSRVPGGVSGGMETADVTGWIPLLYAGLGVDLPLTGLSLGANGSIMGYQGNRLYDVTLQASYTTPWNAGADLGYRRPKLGLDDFDSYSADIEFSGPYAGVFVKF
ncbi:MAG: TIGR04219 family outer membrane beta-barrel protein [Gammaproteobacteria bacterium]